MTPTEFDRAVQAVLEEPDWEDRVLALVSALSDDAFRDMHQSPPPIGQPEYLGRVIARCIRMDALRRAEGPVPTCWDRLAAD